MTPPRNPLEATDDQLADIARFIARTCLEVERGLRPPQHLQSVMNPHVAGLWRRHNSIGRFAGGPVHDADIGTPHLSRINDTAVLATIITRTEGRRWGALTLKLDARRGRWEIAELQRLLAAAHYRTGPAPQPPRQGTVDERLGLVTGDRRLAAAALDATSRRLADLTPSAPGVRAARDMVRTWRRKLAELDRELAELRTRHPSPARLLRR